MYNGIGLQTARGSGTNGYVQRNLASVRTTKEKVQYKTEDELKKIDSSALKQPNQEILHHERKRKIELKCMELQEMMEDKGYSVEEIQEKVTEYRSMLIEKEGDKPSGTVLDDNGRPIVRETHQLAEANMEKNAKLREAFGISKFFVEGSSLDPARKAKEEAAKSLALAQTKYATVKFSASESEPEIIEEKLRKKKAKKKKKWEPSPSESSESLESSPERSRKRKKKTKQRSESPEIKKDKKKHKKQRRERSSSPEVRKKKEKSRRKSPERKSTNRRRNARRETDSTDDSSSSYSVD